jgi:hypothetical protein
MPDNLYLYKGAIKMNWYVWYVMVESYELGEESYTREEFKTFEEAQQFFEKTEGAWKPQRIKVSSYA